MKKLLLFFAALLTATLALAGCSANPEPTVSVTSDTIIIDVRSAEEFASGHLDGANLLDLNSGEFAAYLPNLDPAAEYLVYCRSGNRSTQAINMMLDAGFTNVTNLGSVQEASKATGISIIK